MNNKAKSSALFAAIAIIAVVIFQNCSSSGSGGSAVATALTLLATVPPNAGTSTNPQVTGAAGANISVQIFGQASCAGSAIGSGQADASGNFSIPVNVTAGATTTLSASSAGVCATENVTYTATNYDPLATTSAATVFASTTTFNMSLPSGTSYIDVKFTEDTSWASTALANANVSGGSIRFFDGALLNSGVSNFDFARLVVIQQAGGNQHLYYVSQFGTETDYASWTTGDNSITTSFNTLAGASYWSTRAGAAKTAKIYLVIDSDLVNALGSGSNALYEALAYLYFSDAVYFAGMNLHLSPVAALAFQSPGADPFTSTNSTTLLQTFSTWVSANVSTGNSIEILFENIAPQSGAEAGSAWVGQLCTSSFSNLVVSANSSVSFQARVLTLAHEIGHVIGLYHPGASNDPCAFTAYGPDQVCPATDLMCSPASGGMKFNSCDIATNVIATQASCLF